MARRTASRWVQVVRIFPPENPVAPLMARMLIHRADLDLEVGGFSVGHDALAPLDRYGKAYRAMFFFRANSRTLESAKYTLMLLTKHPVFLQWCNEDNVEAEWRAAKKRFDQHAQTVYKIRNSIGAHAEEDIEDAIRTMPSGTCGFVEESTDGGMRFPLLAEVLGAAMLKRTGNDGPDWHAGLDRLAIRLSAASNALGELVRLAFSIYDRRVDFWQK